MERPAIKSQEGEREKKELPAKSNSGEKGEGEE